MCVEVFRGDNWSLTGSLEHYRHFDPEQPNDDPEWIPSLFRIDRNSVLFAILANVCNPHCSTSPFDCIDLPRGLPVDVSDELKVWHAQNDGATFAESWLLLKEIIGFDWHGKEIIRQAKVDARAAHLFPPTRNGFPYADWPPGVGASHWEEGSGVPVTWRETYAQAVGAGFFEKIIPRLESFGPPDNVRTIFWFTY